MRKYFLITLTSFFLPLFIFAQSDYLFFNGKDTYVQMKPSPMESLHDGDFTIEAKIKGREKQSLHPMILSNRGNQGGMLVFFHGKWGGSKYKMLCLQLEGDNYFFINNGSYNGSLFDNKEHHIAITKKGLDLAFYIDGNLIGEKKLKRNTAVYSKTPLWIGRDKRTKNVFHGEIYNLRIWNNAKNHFQIKPEINKYFSKRTQNLVGSWKMENIKENKVNDEMDRYHGLVKDNSMVQEEEEEPVYIAPPPREEIPVEESEPAFPFEKQKPQNKKEKKPSFEVISVDTHEESQNVMFELLDVNGMVIHRSRYVKDFDLENKPKGSYTIRTTIISKTVLDQKINLN